VPRVDALLDSARYEVEENMPPKAGQELRAHRAPKLRTMVRYALKCDSAERLGHRLRRRFERQQQRRGTDPGRSARDEAELFEQIDRMMTDPE
jgi:hypothetical protein